MSREGPALTASTDPRRHPTRPFLAVSAGIVRDGRILLVRRATPPAQGLFTFPGGVVEAGETLQAALQREVGEETALTITPIALAGTREMIVRDADGKVERHFVILAFAARWVSGEPVLNDELAEARWVELSEVAALGTTEGLYEIAGEAVRLAQH